MLKRTTKRHSVKSASIRAADHHERAKDFLSEVEIDALLGAAKAGRYGVRDRLLLLMMYRHGLRVSEAIGLRRDEVDLDQARLWVRRLKGGLSAERGQAMLASALAGFVGKPLTAIQTVEQVQATPGARPERTAVDIPPEAQAELVHAALDAQYRALLDEPVPMLGNVSPRAAARSARGRRNVVAWLKYLENGAGNVATPDHPMATYEFSWMWRELKIEKLRS